MSDQPFPPRPSSPDVSDSPDTSLTTTEPDSDAEYCHHVFPRFVSSDLISATTSPASGPPIPTVSGHVDHHAHASEGNLQPTASSAVSREPSGTADSLSPASSSVYFDAVSFIASDEDEVDETPTPGAHSTTPPPLWVDVPILSVSPPPPYDDSEATSASLPNSFGRQLRLWSSEEREATRRRIDQLEESYEAFYQARHARLLAERELAEAGGEVDDPMDIDTESVPSR